MRFQGKIRLSASFVSVVSLLTACSDDDDNGAIIVVDAGDDGGGATTDDTTDDTTADVTDVVTDTNTDTTVGDTSSMFTDDTDTTGTTGVSDGGVSDAGDTDTLGPDAAWDAATPDETWIDSGTDDVSSDVTGSDNPDASDGSMGSELVFPAEAEVQNAAVPEGFAAWQWAEGLEEPRGITVDQSGNVLVVEQDLGRVLALWDDNGDGVSGAGERAVIAAAPGLNHGIALNGGYLYASSATTVYRWAYTNERSALGQGTAVVTGIPSGGHVTRTLVFDANYLYVSVGSANNVDANSDRAQIRRFPIAGLNAATAFYDGELFADGLRNEVGLAVDPQGKVWGVENGMDNLFDSELGGDIHNDNPGEELNLFTTPGAFYGYPYCWSEYQLDADAGMGPGTQWALESDLWDEPISDAWCQDPNNVVPPELVFPGHVAPLGIRFYDGGNFPSEYVGDALVTFHGSWNAQPAVGYKVVRVPFGADGMPSGGWEPLYEFAGPGDTGNSWNERPVDLVVLPNGVVLVTSDDDADRIVAIGFAGL